MNPSTQDYIVVFENNSKSLSKDDKKKVKAFSDNYKSNFSKYNILLIGHTDWKGNPDKNINLSFERVKAVKDELVSNGISDLKIFTTASGSYWPGNSEEKSGREFNRRVDMLFLE
ncbi:MAG: OmpA family protein [Leptospiraceae bacterium]|nr:OmpA family protein [Leptospiraceae bacterium]